MATKDAYAALGLDPRCTDSQIVAMYRHLAKLHHPDRGGDAKRFREIQDAYDAIGSSERRAAYDTRRERQEDQKHFRMRGDMRNENERYDDAYRRYQPDWESDLRAWFERHARETTQQRGRPETEDRGTHETTNERGGWNAPEGRAKERTGVNSIWYRGACGAVIAGIIASILRWIQTGTTGAGSGDDLAAAILYGGVRDPWTWFAAVAAGGLLVWLQILRPGRRNRLWLTGMCAAIAAITLAGAGASILTWQVLAWSLTGAAVRTVNTKWAQKRIRNRLADAR